MSPSMPQSSVPCLSASGFPLDWSEGWTEEAVAQGRADIGLIPMNLTAHRGLS